MIIKWLLGVSRWWHGVLDARTSRIKVRPGEWEYSREGDRP